MKFIQFGCWNKYFCNIDDPKVSPISNVMHNIKLKIESGTYDFLIVSGDNYYPETIKHKNKKLKIKVFNFEDFISGFNCLSNLPINKYLLFGNHEYNDNVILKEDLDKLNSLPKEKKEEELIKLIPHKCKSLIEQKNIASVDSSIIIFQSVLFNYEDSTKTLLIMIDTTIYDDIKNIECYKNILGETDDINATRLKITQYAQVLEILKAYTDASTIIFSGHHPIIWCKNKDEKNKFNYVEGLISLFSQFEEFLIEKKIIYLCADTHIYQKGDVLIKTENDNILLIEQHIVGTGGADLDNLCIDNYKLISSRYPEELIEVQPSIIEELSTGEIKEDLQTEEQPSIIEELSTGEIKEDLQAEEQPSIIEGLSTKEDLQAEEVLIKQEQAQASLTSNTSIIPKVGKNVEITNFNDFKKLEYNITQQSHSYGFLEYDNGLINFVNVNFLNSKQSKKFKVNY